MGEVESCPAGDKCPSRAFSASLSLRPQQECGRGKPSWICPEPSSRGWNVSPAGAVTFRMDRPTFANIFLSFPLRAWLPLLFLPVPEVSTVVPAWSGSRWEVAKPPPGCHCPCSQAGSAGTRGCGLFALIPYPGIQPDNIDPLGGEGINAGTCSSGLCNPNPAKATPKSCTEIPPWAGGVGSSCLVQVAQMGKF